MVLPSAYLPPISWFSSLVKGEPVMVEQYENYHKQTIRNRCTIDSPNGPLKDVRISTHNAWQRQHWYALETSYFNSPFFEYLQDDFRPLYEQQWTFLIDFNEALIQKCCEMLDIQPNISRTHKYIGLTPLESDFHPTPYYQVFQQKHEFLPNLSIIDLIFNMGNESLLFLKR